MCILDFITNSNSSKSVHEKLHQFLTHKYKDNKLGVVYFSDNISMVEKGRMLVEENSVANFILDRKKEWDAKTATFDFSSDDRERSSTDEDNDCLNSTCTLCTSSFSFCNASQHSFK